MADDLNTLAFELGERLKSKQMMMAVAESCTGGWVAKVITDVPGSSHWFERGFVTYTNSAKQEMLGVIAKTLEQFGAVSLETATEMALGAVTNSHAQVAVAISGIAGPGGGSDDKPVGTVCLAWAGLAQSSACRRQFSGDREAVRRQAVAAALTGLNEYLLQYG
ncbi:MAG: nicotinamide-nucleotide amidase [Gammaproteobacteria bacterium]|nr:nicotinamide-nucleotide amidase [Gammaproteobacteria bacterium]